MPKLIIMTDEKCVLWNELCKWEHIVRLSKQQTLKWKKSGFPVVTYVYLLQ